MKITKKCTAIMLAAILAAMPLTVHAQDIVSDITAQTAQSVQFTPVEGTTIQYSSSVSEEDVQELLACYCKIPESLKLFFNNNGIGIYLCNSWETGSLPTSPSIQPDWGGINDITYTTSINGTTKIKSQYIYVFADQLNTTSIAQAFSHECGHFVSSNSYCAKGDDFIYELSDLDDFTNLATNYEKIIRVYANGTYVYIPDGMCHEAKSEMFAVAFSASIIDPNYVNLVAPELYDYVVNAAATISK